MADRASVTNGSSELFVAVDGKRPQLSLKQKANSVDLVTADDVASVSVVGPNAARQSLRAVSGIVRGEPSGITRAGPTVDVCSPLRFAGRHIRCQLHLSSRP
jgi:hypothetical protein